VLGRGVEEAWGRLGGVGWGRAAISSQPNAARKINSGDGIQKHDCIRPRLAQGKGDGEGERRQRERPVPLLGSFLGWALQTSIQSGRSVGLDGSGF